MWSLVNTQKVHYCAFCRYWYDPTNSAIKPKNNKFWEFNTQVEALCFKKNYKKQSVHSCSAFECKL